MKVVIIIKAVIIILVIPALVWAQVVINEIMYYPQDKDSEWVELYNQGKEPVNIDTWEISDEDGNIYKIPDVLPDVPSEAYVVIIFGDGVNDYDFSDNRVILYTKEPRNIFNDKADQCSLYINSLHTEKTIVDFVAWGDMPDGDGINASKAGIWPTSKIFVNTFFLLEGAPRTLITGESIGLYPGEDTNRAADWIIYHEEEVSQGQENTVPSPYLITPWDGAETTDHSVSFGWYSIKCIKLYQLQVSKDSSFSSPEINIHTEKTIFTPTTLFLDGKYYWRVKAIDKIDRESRWSNPAEITIFTP